MRSRAVPQVKKHSPRCRYRTPEVKKRVQKLVLDPVKKWCLNGAEPGGLYTPHPIRLRLTCCSLWRIQNFCFCRTTVRPPSPRLYVSRP